MRPRRYFRPLIETLEHRIALATWPVPDSHEMGLGFGAGVAPVYFHDGIDILADGDGGQRVIAARGGTVFWNNSAYSGGMVTIEVDVGDGKKEYDEYLHVSDIVAPAKGT